jgi:hypothetical protein
MQFRNLKFEVRIGTAVEIVDSIAGGSSASAMSMRS